MQQNPKSLVEKHNESLLLMPLIFSSRGYDVSITDPPWANYGWTPDLSIFKPYPAIHAENVSLAYAAYADYWMKNHPDIKIASIASLLEERLFRFSLFKIAPRIVRIFLYDRGDWLTINDRDIRESNNELTLNMIGKYAALDYLPEITGIDTNHAGSLVMLFNELTHDPAFLQAPDYVPAPLVTNKGNSPFSREAHYHVSVAAFALLGKWFNFLKENNIYDNTRIIVVSDHGYNIDTGKHDFILPGGDMVEKYTSLLLVKDFYAGGALKTDDSFMTQADVPLLAFNGIIDNPVNPFSGMPVTNEKENGILVTTSSNFYPTNHGKYRFNISKNEWLHVKDNIFDEKNWSRAKKSP